MNDETTCKQLYEKCLHSCISSQYLWQIAVYDRPFLTGKGCWPPSSTTCNLLWLLWTCACIMCWVSSFIANDF